MTLPFTPQKASKVKDQGALIDKAGAEPERFHMEPKFDGWRMVAIAADEPEPDPTTGSKVELYGINGKRLTDHLPHVVEWLEERLPPGSTLDGEAVSEDGDWGKVQSALGGHPKPAVAATGIHFAVFDMLAALGESLMEKTLIDRLEFLDYLQAKLLAGGPASATPRYDVTVENYEAIVAAGFEGAVVKDLTSIYVPGARGRGWSKLKVTETEDCVVMECKPGDGERGQSRGLGTMVIGQYRDGELVERGACGGGFTDEWARETWARREEVVGAVIEVKHFGIGNGGGLRHPQYVRTRTDKRAEECLWT